MIAQERHTCRICEGSLEEILNLGDFALSDFVEAGTVDVRVPLILCECAACRLVQLRHTVDRERLYRHFWYRSGINPSMVSSLRDVVRSIEERITLNAGDVVVDIGTNDGTLLTLYTEEVTKIGFEPARNLAQEAEAACDVFVNDFFETYEGELPKAKVITSIAMFYDLDEPRSFVKRVAEVLDQEGIWVVQMTDLVRMLQAVAFDNICHEHLVYYSLKTLADLVAEYDLQVIDVDFNDVNGGSLRVYIGFAGEREPSDEVASALEYEEKYLESGALERFRDRATKAKESVCRFITKERAAGKRFHVLGASTKGNTLLQFFGLSEEIECAAEVNREKFGLKTAGSKIPIVSQEESLARKPDYYLVLPWHFIRFFRTRLSHYMDGGVALLVPLPEPRVYRNEVFHLP